MRDLETVRRQHATDQQMAMAASRIFFTAHQRDTPPVATRLNPADSLLERGSFGKPSIEHVTVIVVEFLTRRSTAQLVPHGDIGDTDCPETLFQ